MIDARKWLRRDIGEEFAAAELGDARRTSRLQLIARAAEYLPDAGFPQMAESDGELEGIYRFFSNDAVTPSSILEPHIAATVERARQAKTCLVVHDTTEFEFSGDRDGLGLLSSNKHQGFYAHFAMAVLPGQERIPLGILGLERISRQVRKKTVRKNHSDHTAKDPTRESLRWLRGLESTESRREGFECVHVMDREGDMFDLLALALRLEARFVIRGGRNRALANGMGSIEDLLPKTAVRTHREAEVSVRVPKRRELIAPRRGAERKERTAKLGIGSHVVELRRPKSKKKVPERSVKINVVHVWELEPPQDEDPVEWVLFTTEPVDTIEQLNAVVDYYQSRWIIEEFFKSLKTGCAFEKRQLESFHALSNALAVFSIVAWRMLLARAVVRAYPDGTPTSVLSRNQLLLLRHRLKLPKLPATAEEALYAVARLGGHLKRNGAPGWLTLGRGFEKLLFLQAGWNAAIAHFSLEDPINP
jgi:hypothetical protein